MRWEGEGVLLRRWCPEAGTKGQRTLAVANCASWVSVSGFLTPSGTGLWEQQAFCEGLWVRETSARGELPLYWRNPVSAAAFLPLVRNFSGQLEPWDADEAVRKTAAWVAQPRTAGNRESCTICSCYMSHDNMMDQRRAPQGCPIFGWLPFTSVLCCRWWESRAQLCAWLCSAPPALNKASAWCTLAFPRRAGIALLLAMPRRSKGT